MRFTRRTTWSAAILAAACCLGTSTDASRSATADEDGAPAPTRTTQKDGLVAVESVIDGGDRFLGPP